MELKIIGLFWSTKENRVKSLWRIIIFLLVIILVVSFARKLVSPVFVPLFNKLNPNDLNSDNVSDLFAITISVFFVNICIDKRTLHDLGVVFSKESLLELIKGFFITFVAVALVFFILITNGNSKLLIIDLSYRFVLRFAGLFITAWWEEIVFRGYLNKNIEEGCNKILASFITSFLFGFLHAYNFETRAFDVISFLSVSLSGFLLWLGVFFTGKLWLSIGMHFGWDFFQGTFFGFSTNTKNYSFVHQSSFPSSYWIFQLLLWIIIFVYVYCKDFLKAYRRIFRIQ